jgi:hypothetical protein
VRVEPTERVASHREFDLIRCHHNDDPPTPVGVVHDDEQAADNNDVPGDHHHDPASDHHDPGDDHHDPASDHHDTGTDYYDNGSSDEHLGGRCTDEQQHHDEQPGRSDDLVEFDPVGVDHRGHCGCCRRGRGRARGVGSQPAASSSNLAGRDEGSSGGGHRGGCTHPEPSRPGR